MMSLLLQLNGALPQHFPGHERRLYLFGCRRKPCKRKDGSIRGIRGVRIDKSMTASASKAKRQPRESLDNPTAAPSNTPKNPFASADSNGTAYNPFSSSSGAVNPFSSTQWSGSGGAASNPFASSSVAPKMAQRADLGSLTETFASKARIAAQDEPPKTADVLPPYESWPSEADLPPSYPSYYLDADYESLEPEKPTVPNGTRMDIDGEGSSSGGSNGKEDKEAFESAMDKTFQRFADRLAQNPEQVLRYEFRGQPLLYSHDDKVGKALEQHQSSGANTQVKVQNHSGKSGMPRCNSCGAERVFELQLTPQAIAELEAEEVGMDGMEWGTIVLGVCGRDCAPRNANEGEIGYVEEWVGVQWEEPAGPPAKVA